MIANKEAESKVPLQPIKRCTPIEAKERRDHGLCCNCNEKYDPGLKSQMQCTEAILHRRAIAKRSLT